ncbi:MAG: hypothetical protein IPJ34_40905 [Myxococcales bacterium]|nr:hypothetical protein [Myxococcales bacterium]
MRLGAPFYLSVAIPALLEQLPQADESDGEQPRLLPFEGRGSSSYIYHTLWAGSVAPPAEVEKLRGRIERFKVVGLKDDAAEAQVELEAALGRKTCGVVGLASPTRATGDHHTWMRRASACDI